MFWHVISKDTTVPGGNVPYVVRSLSDWRLLTRVSLPSDSQIAAQIATLNASYKNASLTFELAGTDRTIDANWFDKATDGTVEQTEMKTALRKGGVLDLNVYTVRYDPWHLLWYDRNQV